MIGGFSERHISSLVLTVVPTDGFVGKLMFILGQYPPEVTYENVTAFLLH